MELLQLGILAGILELWAKIEGLGTAPSPLLLPPL